MHTHNLHQYRSVITKRALKLQSTCPNRVSVCRALPTLHSRRIVTAVMPFRQSSGWIQSEGPHVRYRHVQRGNHWSVDVKGSDWKIITISRKLKPEASVSGLSAEEWYCVRQEEEGPVYFLITGTVQELTAWWQRRWWRWKKERNIGSVIELQAYFFRNTDPNSYWAPSEQSPELGLTNQHPQNLLLHLQYQYYSPFNILMSFPAQNTPTLSR